MGPLNKTSNRLLQLVLPPVTRCFSVQTEIGPLALTLSSNFVSFSLTQRRLTAEPYCKMLLWQKKNCSFTSVVLNKPCDLIC